MYLESNAVHPGLPFGPAAVTQPLRWTPHDYSTVASSHQSSGSFGSVAASAASIGRLERIVK
jgi:hypothetical protein